MNKTGEDAALSALLQDDFLDDSELGHGPLKIAETGKSKPYSLVADYSSDESVTILDAPMANVELESFLDVSRVLNDELGKTAT